MITIKFKIEYLNEEDRNIVDKYQQLYSSCLHVFYRILSQEEYLKTEYYYLSSDSNLSLRFKELNNVELMQENTWIYRSCIKEALSLIKTNKHVVFGGKKNLDKRKNNKITKELWKECRKSSILSVGTAKPYKGNLKLEI